MFWTACKVFFAMTFLTGCLYPFFVTEIVTLTMPHQAYGSLIYQNEKLIGSELIGHLFYGDRYFWPRPSTVDYNALLSKGSNLGPTSRLLKETVEKRAQELAKIHSSFPDLIPTDLLYASASGLDPHISLRAAQFQVNRVAQARKLSPQEKERLVELIDQLVENRLGFLGPSYINVVRLNHQIDQQFTPQY